MMVTGQSKAQMTAAKWAVNVIGWKPQTMAASITKAEME